MSEEYISREAAIKAVVAMTIYADAPALNAAVETEYHRGREWIGGVRDALIEIGDLPAADVRPVKRGKWIAQYSGSHFAQYRCSCCNMACEMVFNFCPNCGAAMEG